MIDLLNCILHLCEFRHNHLCWGAASVSCKWLGSSRCLHPEHSEGVGSIPAPFWQVSGNRAHTQERILGRENMSQQYSDKHKQWQKATSPTENQPKDDFWSFPWVSLRHSTAPQEEESSGIIPQQPAPHRASTWQKTDPCRAKVVLDLFCSSWGCARGCEQEWWRGAGINSQTLQL